MLHVGDMAHVEFLVAVLLQQLGYEQVPEPIGQLPRLKGHGSSGDRDPDCLRTVRHRFRLGIECV
jgi:hypothetical protein